MTEEQVCFSHLRTDLKILFLLINFMFIIFKRDNEGLFPNGAQINNNRIS